MESFNNLLQQDIFLILDGAVATELEKRGANLIHELWSAKVLIEQPELIKKTHLDYLRAGADIICTATYQASFEGFHKIGIDNTQALSLFKLSVDLAKQARIEYQQETNRSDALIAASIGPYGAYLADGSEYTGDYNIDGAALKKFHLDRLNCLIDEDVDLLIFETFPNFAEITEIVNLLNSLSHPPVFFSLSCKDENTLRDSTPLKEVIQILDHSTDIDVIGVNCIPPSLVTPLLKNIGSLTSKPLMAYPNSGEGWDAINKRWINSCFEDNLKDNWIDWLSLGAKVIGGCCRTTPSNIEDLNLFRKELEGTK